MNAQAPIHITPPEIGNSSFRLDILGLRGLAILFVVASHLNIPGSSAGFIGVDMFFVVSGYLIIGLMFREYLQNGKSLGGYGWVSIGSFYQRRARRILPAATFVLVTVYLTSQFIQDDSFRVQTRRDTIWAFLFASNISFAKRQTDYFASAELVSPLIHYWSLAVEEQFYLLMPFLFMAIVNWHGFSFAGRRLSARPRVMFGLASVGILSLISLIILSLYPTESLYFQTFPRIWEFTVGGLAAIIRPTNSHRSKIYLLLFRRVSFAVLALCFLLISPTSSMVMIVLPAFATAIILYANQQLRFGFFYKRILTNSLLTFFGRISYSLYLWHWPILVYSKYFGLQPSWISTLGLLVAMVGVSILSERFIERPFLRIGYMSDFHLPKIVKSRRAMTASFLVLTGGLFFVTYQPVISSLINKTIAQREQPFWTPQLEVPGVTPAAPSMPPNAAPPVAPKQEKRIFLGIFGDSTNQCCSATGAFWPRLLARNFNWQFSDYSKPATSFITSGVGSNNCKTSRDCPSVEGQLKQASKKTFDAISISAGIGDCSLARSNPEELLKNVTGILQDFRESYPSALIFATSLTHPASGPRSDCNSRLNVIIQSASEASNIMYIDVSRAVSNPVVQVTRDGSHLTDSGHALIAKRIVNFLQKTPEFTSLLKM